ncbi:uncharacterized protein TNCV_4872851 [Trichonephila clavipes]|nr:uncharacterized protein TNCV_4872851 [Trichonephila clavipes]
MEESKNDVGCLEQLLLYADEHYLAGKLPLGDHLGKVLHWVEEYHQRSARKGCLELSFASARCLEIVCGTIATPTSARIVERDPVGSTSACRMILRSSLLVVFLGTPDPVFYAWVHSRVHCSQQFLTAHSERSTWPASRRVDQPAVFIPMIRPLSNSLNCEKCLLARLHACFAYQSLPTIGGNEKVSNHGSIPITIDCNVVAFIGFEELFHQLIKRTKQSVFLDVTVVRHTLLD